MAKKAKKKTRTKTKRPVGRPTKLDDLRDEFIGHIRAGNYIETACKLTGVSKQTFYVWLEKGRSQNTGKYREFVDAVEKAQAEVEDELLGAITRAAQENWKAAAWRLEHMRPRRYAQRQRIEHTGRSGGPIETRELRSLTDDELEAIARGDK